MVRVASVGVLTGWGPGVGALPADAGQAAAGRPVIPLPRPALQGDRFRRATRECLLGVAAVQAMLAEAGLDREAIAGDRTALVYVTAGAYGASNRAFVEGGAAGPGALHFPYTAPSAVPGEVAIEFGLRGGYVILVGGAAATVDALWHAATQLARGTCDGALVLAVETFAECADLYARGRWRVPRPLVEAAACALLRPGEGDGGYGAAAEASALETLAARRAGQTLACGPLIALALARAAGARPAHITGEWRGRRAAVQCVVAEKAGA